MKFNRQSFIPSIDNVLSAESMQRLSMISAYLTLYVAEGNKSGPSLRLSSSTLAMKRVVIAAEETEPSRQQAVADVQETVRILEKARRAGDEVYESYLKTNENNLRAVFFRWMMTQIPTLVKRINSQKKALLQSYNVGESEIMDMADEAVHEFITRTEGKTNLLASLAAWQPEKGASLLTWTLNGAAKMMDTIVGQNQQRILTQTKSLNETLKGKDGDGDTLGDMVAAPSMPQDADDFDADQIRNIDDLMNTFKEALHKRIVEQPAYIKGLLDRGRKAMEARLQNASDPIQEEAEFNEATQMMDQLYSQMMESFNDLKSAVKIMRESGEDADKRNAITARDGYERRVQSLLRNLVEAFNPELARRKRRKNSTPDATVGEIPMTPASDSPSVSPVKEKVTKPRASDFIKEEDRIGRDYVTPEELAAKKAEVEEFRKKLLPYYYRVGAYPDSRVGPDGKRTPYQLKSYGMGLIPPYRHLYSGLNTPDELEVLFGDNEEAIASLNPMALFSRLLIEGGLKAHEEYNLERKFRIPGANIGQSEAERFRNYVLDQIDTNPIYKAHRPVLVQMLENFFLNKSGKYTEEKFEEMTEGFDTHTRVSAYEWARNEIAKEQGTEPKSWTEMSDEELGMVANRAWEALYPQGFRRFRVQQIDEQGNPISKGPIMALNRWQNPVAFQKIMEEEAQNVRQMVSDIESGEAFSGSRADKKQRRKHPIAYRSRLDADTPPVVLGNAAKLLLQQQQQQQPESVDVAPVLPVESMPEPNMIEEGMEVRAHKLQELLTRIAAFEQEGDYVSADASMRVLESMLKEI